MINIPIWTFWILIAVAISILLFFQKKHEQMLSSNQMREKARVLSEANNFRHWQNWSFILVSAILVVVNLFSATEFPIKSLFYLVAINLIYTIFRNRKISRQIHLPDEYVNKEFNLGISTVLLFAIAIFFIF